VASRLAGSELDQMHGGDEVTEAKRWYFA